MKNIILKPVDIGDTGEQARDKINETSGSITEAVRSLDQEVVKRVNISQVLGFSQDKVPSEYAMSKSLAAKADKSEISSVVTGLIYKEPVDDFSDLFKYANPQKGWAALVRNVSGYPDGAIYSWNGTTWANTGLSGFPQDVATKSTIYNISQAKNIYNYPDNQTARNAVATEKRTYGQIISYKLASGKWITEQYIAADLTGWATDSNWEKIGDIEIYQSIDETADKAISPDGVFKGLVNAGGFERNIVSGGEEPEFSNIIPSYSAQSGKFLNNDGTEVSNGAFCYNEIYVPVVPGRKYLTNLPGFNSPRFVGYDANKNNKGNINLNDGADITIPDNIYFVRYNYRTGAVGEKFYIYEAPQPVVYGNNLSTKISSDNIKNAVRIDSISHNAIPYGLGNSPKMIDSNGNPTVGVGCHSDNVPVTGGKTYITNLPAISGGVPLLYFFDKNDYPIGSLGNEAQFTAPVNAAYLQFNSWSTVFDGFYITDESKSAFYIEGLFVPKDNVIDMGGSTGFPKEYRALGDSITAGGAGLTTYAVRLARALGFNMQNHAASSALTLGLGLQINSIPQDFEGLITVMIGVNDYNRGLTLGDVNEVLSKKYEDLNVNSSSAEAFRWAVETIIRKAPKAVFVNIPPIHTGVHVTDSIQGLRNMQHTVCDYFAVPCADIYKTCKISPVKYPDYMPDGIHPNDLGHAEIARVLYPAVKMYLP